MVNASDPAGSEKSAARLVTATPPPSKDAIAAKRNGRIAWFLALALLVMFCYFNWYRPNQQKQELHDLWDAAQALVTPAQWDGSQGVLQTAPFAFGVFDTKFAAGTDPVASLLEWLGKLDSTDTPSDVDLLRYECFTPGAVCNFDFELGKYKGRVDVYYETVPPTPEAKGQYEMWLPQ